MEIVFHLARADNGVIGRDGRLPWHLPEDLKRFKTATMGKPMLMGRKTFESLGRPLPGRRHIVLTRDPSWRADGAEMFSTVEEAIAAAGDVPELAVIGGAEIFATMLSRADRICLTEVHAQPEGDAVVPPFDAEWRETSREDHDGYSFVVLERAG